jgi:hypothetical protein
MFRKFLSAAVFSVLLISSSAFAEVSQSAATPSPSVEATPTPPQPAVEASPPASKCSPFVCPDVPLLQRRKSTPAVSKDVKADEVQPVKAKTKKAKTRARKIKAKTNAPATETK